MFSNNTSTGSRRRYAFTKRDYNVLMIGILIGMVSLMLVTVNVLTLADKNRQDEVAELKATIAQHEEVVAELNKAHEKEIEALNKIISEKDQTIADKEANYQQLMNDIAVEASVDFEFLQKYDYVIDRVVKEGNCGFTVEMMKLVDDLCREKNLNPHMIFAIIDIESDYHTDAKNSKSTARGLGQVLKSTGKSVYENMMKAGTYNHDMAYNGYTNITMMVTYIEYLKNTYGDINVMINGYSGDQTGRYYNNKYLTQMKAYGQDPSINHYN